MTLVNRFLILATVVMCGFVLIAADEKQPPAPAPPTIPTVKKEVKAEAKTTDDDEAKKQQEANEAGQQEFEKQLKKAQADAEKVASHTLIKEVKLTGRDGNSLQTIGVDASGRILALVAPPRGFSNNQKNVISEIHVLDQDGKPVGVWTVNFHANSVNAGPDGTVYVAGDGKLAKFSKDGKPIGEVAELPFIADMLKDKDKLKAMAEKQVKLQKASFEGLTKQYTQILDKLEEKEKAAKEKGEELTKVDATKLKQYRQIVDSFKQSNNSSNSITVESVLEGILGRVKVINSVSVNDKELFLVCGENEGYGFGLWRMDLDLKNAKKITSNLSGCCGQMDAQCCGDDIVVAENTKHRFARYNRDGKELSAGGKRGKETEPGCFGSCCNPMNIKACGADILTSESEGIIKLFGSTGEFKGIVGAVKITGGCKNVAVGANADASRIYFCDQPGGRVLILAKK